MELSAAHNAGAPKHLRCISLNSFPRGELSNTVTSSKRYEFEKVMLTAASVTVTLVSPVSRMDEAQMVWLALGDSMMSGGAQFFER